MYKQQIYKKSAKKNGNIFEKKKIKTKNCFN